MNTTLPSPFVQFPTKEVKLHNVSIGQAKNWSEAVRVLREFGYALFGPRYVENSVATQQLAAEVDLRKLLGVSDLSVAGLSRHTSEGPTTFQFYF